MALKRREFLQTSAGVVLAAASPFWTTVSRAADAAKKRRILYFTRCQGFVHEPVHRPGAKSDQLASSEKWVQQMGAKHGFDVVCSKEGSVFDGDLAQFDAFVFYTSGDLTKPVTNTEKEPTSSPMTAAGKQRLLSAIEAGKGFVGIHAATDSFRTPRDQVDPYIAMVGGEFISHGAQQEANMQVASGGFPGLKGLKDFRLHEEWYSHVKFAKDLHVILVQDTKGMVGWEYERPPYPATWARACGKGRVFYTSMGHGDEMFARPIFEQVLIAGLWWAAGETSFEPTPNVAQVCPNANTWPTRPASSAKGEKKGEKGKRKAAKQ